MNFFENEVAAAQQRLEAAKAADKAVREAWNLSIASVTKAVDEAWDKLDTAKALCEKVRKLNALFQDCLIHGFPPKEGVWLCLLEDKTGQFVRTVSWNQRGLNDDPEGWYLAGNSSIKKIYQDFKIIGWYPIELPNN